MKVYLDNIATTRIDKRVFEAMMPYFTDNFGNPSSIHSIGQTSHGALISARDNVANFIGAKGEEVIFTQSATEANNLALKGGTEAYKNKGMHIISSKIEHLSILHPLKTLEKHGFKVTLVGVDKEGRINPEDIIKALRPDTILVSIQLANPEIGTIQPIEEINQIIRRYQSTSHQSTSHQSTRAPEHQSTRAPEHQIIFHCDATVAIGRIPVNVDELGVDSLSFSSHLIYGPKGAGALYIKKGTRVLPQIEGGIQEHGRRAGTENVASIVGFSKACELSKDEMAERNKQIINLEKRLIDGITKTIEGVHLNSPKIKKVPGIVNFSFDFVEGESMLMSLDMEGICVASGSACVSHALKASPVLIAMGISPVLANGSLLFSIGKDNREEDIDYLLEILPPIIKRLRSISPLTKK